MIVASANLLDDSLVPKYAPQIERLPKIAADLTSIAGMYSPDILFMCEGASDENLYELAERTGLQLAAEPVQYSRHERMAIAIRPSLMRDVVVEEIRYGKKNNFQPVFLVARMPGIQLIGLHHPHRMFRDTHARHQGTDAILQNIHPDIPTIVTGDANAMQFQIPRKKLIKAGLIEAHKNMRPRCPTPEFRHLTGLRYVPNPSVNLDIILHSSHFNVTQKGTIMSASDHAFLWAELELKNSQYVSGHYKNPEVSNQL